MIDLIANGLVARASVVGLFGGAGLALTMIYSRRGAAIYPVYAALLAALAILLARHSETIYTVRLVAALIGFSTANVIAYVTAGVLASRQRDALVVQGRSSPGAHGVSFLGHAVRWAFLLIAGALISAALAFVSA